MSRRLPGPLPKDSGPGFVLPVSRVFSLEWGCTLVRVGEMSGEEEYMVGNGEVRSIASDFAVAMDRASDTGVQIREVARLTLIRVEVDPLSAAARRVERVLGVSFPREAGEVTGDSSALDILYGTRQIVACLWVHDDSFLVVTRVDGVKLGRALSSALGDEAGLVLDVSANRSVVELSGPEAERVLEKTVIFESAPDSLGEGVALRCCVGAAEMMLWHTDRHQYLLLPRSADTAPFLVAMLDAIDEVSGGREARPGIPGH